MKQRQRDALTEAAVILQAAVGLHQTGRAREAEAAYRRVLTLDPACADALGLLGLIHHDRGERDMAERLMRSAIAILPAARFYHNLGAVLEGAGDIPGCVAAFREASAMEDGDVISAASVIFNGDLHPYATPALRLADRRIFNARFCAALTKAAPPNTNNPDPNRRLKIGYISADFADHSASMVFGPVLAGHDHQNVEVYCYWQQRGPADAITAKFKAQADHWRDIAPLSDEDLATLIRQDRIDILVDLTGFSNGHRLQALARKPAPIIMTGWGHVTGLGIDACDYILADAIAAPEALAHQHHERALHLPCTLAFDPRPPYPDVAPAPAERNGYVTFGYFGRALKTSELVWATWANILQYVPGSRLVFKGREYTDLNYQRKLVEFFESLRVDRSRIDFWGPTHRSQHLAAYGQVDIALDPFPHGGGVTTLEATLMGVPSIAMMGDHLNGRISASMLKTIGHPEWVAFSAEQYIALGAAMAARTITLADRQAIRSALLDSIICDQKGYAQATEAVYRQAWQSWCESRVEQSATMLATA